MKKGFYTEKNLAKFVNALKEAIELVKSGVEMHVSISNANSKMGNVASVSTLPFLTCPSRCKDTCGIDCYAAKFANLRPSVLKSYAKNTALAMYNPELFWSEVEIAVAGVRFFRFHVSGDIINMDYFLHMISCAVKNPKTEILVFTKRYEVVNEWISENGKLPENMHLLFSEWSNLRAENPYNMPTTNVFMDEDQIQENWKICGGNCFNCACRGLGCWQAKNGETIAFKKH